MLFLTRIVPCELTRTTSRWTSGRRRAASGRISASSSAKRFSRRPLAAATFSTTHAS